MERAHRHIRLIKHSYRPALNFKHGSVEIGAFKMAARPAAGAARGGAGRDAHPRKMRGQRRRHNLKSTGLTHNFPVDPAV